MNAPSQSLPEYAPFIAGESVPSGELETLASPWDGAPLAVIHQSTPKLLERAVQAARSAAPRLAAMTNFERAELLDRVGQLLRARGLQAVKAIMAGHQYMKK